MIQMFSQFFSMLARFFSMADELAQAGEAVAQTANAHAQSFKQQEMDKLEAKTKENKRLLEEVA